MNQELLAVQADGGLLGAYQYLHLHSYIRHWPPLHKSSIPESASNQERLYLSLARYAHIHETRHFHDFFGTLAGASLFFAHFKMVRALASMMEMSCLTDERWHLPFPQWTEQSKFSDFYRRHALSWSAYRKAVIKMTDAFRPRAIERQFPNEYALRVATSVGGDPTPAFPFDVGIPEKDLRLTVVYPLSLTALLEGSAQAIQRSLAEAEFPPELAAELTPHRIGQLQLRKEEPEADFLDRIAASIQPYNVTDLTLSKYLRLKSGKQSFLREALMRLTDIALSSSAIRPAQQDDLNLPTSFDVSCVGTEFVRMMEELLPEDLARSKIEYPKVCLEAYSQLLAQLNAMPSPEALAYRNDLLSPLDMLEATIGRHVMAPLIKARVESSHAVYYSVTEYMRRFPELPAVPVLEHDGGLIFASYMSDEACDAWGKYVFLSRVLAQMMDGALILTCPRSDHTVGHIGDATFSMDGECSEHIDNGECGGWHPESWRPLPSCLFSNLLAVFRRGEVGGKA